MDDLAGKRVTVAGLGHFGGGIAVARWLVEQGSKVLVTDREPAEKLADSIQQLAGLPIDYHLGGHRECDFTDAQMVVTSPAVPPSSPYIQAAIRAGVPVSTEMRLFLERCPATRVVGVTGTKGKSTTTALLERMLKTRHVTWMGGNIGKSLLANLADIQPDHVVLLELSSYMLEYLRPMEWSPHVALVTFLSMDHTAWHGSHDAYLDAKINLVRYQSPTDYAVLPDGNPADQFAAATKAAVTRYRLSDRRFDLPRLPGDHNQLNAQAAFLAAEKLGVTWTDAQAAIADFGGLPHRLQLVHEAGGVRFYNDSIATIPEAAVVANQAFEPGRVIQIIGGSDKQLDMRPMCQALRQRCKAILTIGQIGPQLAMLCCGESACVEECETLDRAMQAAKSLAAPGDVVLLSTGTASYGQFTNFEERGEKFAQLARSTFGVAT
jgi:UDP-N-acetylmuramoylalanine--D-glutamate ligase